MGKAVSKALGTSQAQCDTYGFGGIQLKKPSPMTRAFYHN